MSSTYPSRWSNTTLYVPLRSVAFAFAVPTAANIAVAKTAALPGLFIGFSFREPDLSGGRRRRYHDYGRPGDPR